VLNIVGGVKGVKSSSKKMSKDDKLRELAAQLRLRALELTQNSGSAPMDAIRGHIDEFVNATSNSPNVIASALGALPLMQLQKIHSSLGSGNQEHKINVCAKMLFNTDIDLINAQISDFKAAEAAIQHVVSLAFHQSYYTEDGIYDMKSYSTDVLEAIIGKRAAPAAPAGAGGTV